MAEQTSAQRVFLTGGSGFVGRAIIDALLERGRTVRALVRRTPIDRPGVESVQGDLFNPSRLADAMRDCSAVIHLVGIIRESPRDGQTFERVHFDAARGVIEAAGQAGVRRFVHMSALGARIDSPSDYARTKALAEDYLRHSGLAWTIYRPSVIHGPDGAFMKMVADFARGRTMPYVFMPYFGVGPFGWRSRRLQPVYVQDVARAFADAVERDDLAGKTIDLVGAQQLSWPQMYRTVAARLGQNRPAIGIPCWYATLLTHVLPAQWMPFNHSQVVMAGEDNVGDAAAIEKQLGWRPAGFEEALERYASSL